MISYTLTDIQAASPGYPTAALQRRVYPGGSVKLVFVPDPPDHGHPEAMWVKVTAIRNGTYIGTLDNQPTPGKGLPDYGAAVTFESRHIITVTPYQDPDSI